VIVTKRTLERAHWFFSRMSAPLPCDPVLELAARIEAAKVPADLYSCSKALEANGFSDEERDGLHRAIDDRFRTLARASTVQPI